MTEEEAQMAESLARARQRRKVLDRRERCLEVLWRVADSKFEPEELRVRAAAAYLAATREDP